MMFFLMGAPMAVIAVLLAVWGLSLPFPDALLPLWASFATLMSGLAYLLNMPQLLGKQDGQLNPLATLLTLPVLLVVRSIWWIRRKISNEAICNRVAPGLYVGRRPLAGELPTDVAHIVDLTCEFSEVKAIRNGRQYRSLPTMDGSVPPDIDAFRALVDEAAHTDASVYVHCAYGHGRAALMAAAILIRRGIADGPTEAYTMLKRERPGIRPNRLQRAWLQRVESVKAS